MKARIRYRNDTNENWRTVEDTYAPAKGELVFFNDTRTMKIGDGVTKLKSLKEHYGSLTIDVVDEIISRPPSLNDASWSLIAQKAADGTASNYWSVGDRKAVKLNGTVGIKTFTNDTFYVYILGFNHNSTYEGTGIHFAFGYSALTGGADVCFIDENYGGYETSASFTMNTANTNAGGWSSSTMRTNNCAQFYDCLPADLKNVISNTTKYTDNVGGGSDTASNVSATIDKIFLLAEYEIFGTRSKANSAEQNYQEQYAYFASGSNRNEKNDDITCSATHHWWMRSPYYYNDDYFCRVNSVGGSDTMDAQMDYGFAPAFRVGGN